MKKTLYLFSALMCLMLSIASAQTTAFDWTKKACIPGVGRAGIANFSIGNKAYVVSGVTNGFKAIDEVWEYDQTTNTWTQKNNFGGTAVSNPCAFVIGGFAYVGLGEDASSTYHTDFWKYDPTADSWTQVASFPGAARYTGMSFAANGKGYVGCGKGTATYSDFYSYDPVANTWAQIASFPGGSRQTGIGISINNIGYVGLGYNAGTTYNDLYSYNTVTNTWSTLATLTTGGVYSSCCFAIDNVLYVAGGYTGAAYSTGCWGYNTATNTWTTQQSFSCVSPALADWEGFTINGYGFIAGGGNGVSFFNTLLEFGPDDTTFTTRVHVLGNDTSYCGTFSKVLSTGNSCTLWSTGASSSSITVTTPGTYWARIPDTCGMSSDTIHISQLTSASVSITAGGPFTFCQGGSVTLTGNSVPGATYKWTGGSTTQSISVTSSGSYSVTASLSGGCSAASNAVVVTVNPNPAPVLQPSGSFTICSNQSLTLDAGTGYAAYLWSNGATTESIKVNSAGSFKCTVTLNGCSGSSNTDTVNTSKTVPNAVCKNATVTLNNGTASISPADVDGGSTANCGIASRSVAPNTFTTANVGVNTVVLTITDSSGNSSTCNAQVTVVNGGTFDWTVKACLPGAARHGSASFSIGNTAYVVAGGNTVDLSEVWAYDQPTNTWTKKNNYGGGAVIGPSSFVIGNTAYVGLGIDGGGTYHTDFWKYTPTTDTWTQIASFPGAARYTAMSFSANGKGYVGCGKGGNEYNDFYAYDPVANTWTAIASFPGAVRQDGLGLSVNNIGYVGLGLGLSSTAYTDMYSYNSATNTWTQLASYPHGGIYGSANFTIGNDLYVAAGYDGTNFLNGCWGYDIPTNTWTQQEGFGCLAPVQSSWESISLNGHGYIACGANATSYFTNLLEFGPDDTTFTTRVHVLGNDTSYCGSFSRVLSTGNACTLWSDGSTGATLTITTPGTYWARIPGSCGMSSDTIHIGQGNGVASVTITASGPTTFCQGGSVTLDAGAGYTGYHWSNGATTETITVTASSSFSCNVTATSGCTGTSNTVSVTVNSNPSPIIKTSGPTTFCQGGSVTLDAGAGYMGYHWSNGATTETIIVTSSGSFSCNVTATTGCTGTSNTVTVSISTTPPNAVCKNATVVLSNGSASITAANVDGGSTASCGIASETVSPSTFTTADTGVNTVVLTVKDSSGNSATCNAVVTVLNTSSYDWTKKACLPAQGRVGIANFSIGNKAYVVCGITTASPAINEVWEYDQTTNTWAQKNNFGGSALAIPTSFVINGIAYVGLGLDVSNNYHSDFWKYNQATDTWTQIASFPGAARYTAMAFVANGKAYVGCGKGTGTYADFYSYDPTTNTWTAIAPFPGGQRQTGLGLGVNNIGYVGCGYVGGVAFNDMYSYNPATNTWSTIASFPGGGIYALTSFTLNGILYTAAGRNNTTFFSECWGYNPSTNTWTQQQGFSCIAPPRSTWEGFSINGHGYVACGGDGVNDYHDLLEFGPDDTTFTTRSHVLGNDTSFCGAFSLTLSSGAACAIWSTGASSSQITVTTPGTYWVRFADSCGMSSDTIHISQGTGVTGVTITASGATTFCTGGSVVLDAGAGYTGYLWSNGATSETITVTTSGSFSCNVTAKNGCSGISNTVVVTVNSLPAPVIKVSGPTSFCTGGSVILDAGTGYDSYSWSDGETTQTITVTKTGNYSCVVTGGGCSATSNTIVVSVGSLGAPVIKVSGPTTFCSGGSVILDAGPGYDSYSWSDGETTQTITVTKTGNYSCVVTGGGCSATSNTIPVTVNNLAAPVIKVSGPTTFCTGGSVVLDAGAGYRSYAWSDGETTQTITVTKSGNYSCVVTGGGCSATSNTIVVTVNNLGAPVIKVSGPTTFCTGGSVILDAGAGYDSYSWSDGETTQTITVTKTGNYSCVVTGGGCSATSNTIVVTVGSGPAPVVTPAGPVTICSGTGVTLNAGSGYSTYLWSNKATTATIHVTTAGTYACTVTLNGCSGVSNSVIVTLSTTPPNAVCKNDTVTLVNGSASITAANVDGGSTATCGIASETVSPSAFTTANVGVNAVVLTVTDSNGHSATCTAHVTVLNNSTCNPFTCSIKSEPASCGQHSEGNPDVIYLGFGPQSTKLVVSVTGNANFTYSWSPAAHLSCTTCADPVFTPTAPGLYNFTVTVSAGAGCTSTCNITICVLDIRVPQHQCGGHNYGWGGNNFGDQVYVCHYISGCHPYWQTITVYECDVQFFLACHPSDHLGRCDQNCNHHGDGDDADGKDGGNVAQLIPTDNNLNNFSLLMYPNPFTSQFHLNIVSESNDEITLRLMDITGRTILQQSGVQANTDLLLGENLSKGLYLVEVVQGNTRQVIKITRAD